MGKFRRILGVPPLIFGGAISKDFAGDFREICSREFPGFFSGSVYNFPWRRFPRFPGIFRGFAPTGIPWVFLGFGISSGFSRADSRRFHGTSPGKCPALSLDVLCEKFAANSRGVPWDFPKVCPGNFPGISIRISPRTNHQEFPVIFPGYSRVIPRTSWGRAGNFEGKFQEILGVPP